MNDLNKEIEVIRQWVTDMRRNRALDLANANSPEVDAVIREIYLLTQHGVVLKTPTGSLESADVTLHLQEQVTTLTRAVKTLQDGVVAYEANEAMLRKDYQNLQVQLQGQNAHLTRLNRALQEQLKEHKHIQILEQEERALTDALRDTMYTMSNTLDLGKVLDHILDNVERITPYDGANVLLVESDLVHIVRQRGYQAKGADQAWLDQRIPLTMLATLQQLMDMGKPLAIADTSSSPLWIGFPDLEWVSSNVIVPIRSNGKILGFLSLDSATRGYFTQAHAERLQIFADQAAIAIQNARLLDRAKQVAVTAERNRIANELHDTISQTLWSVSLITERLPAIWEADQERGRLSLATVHQLAQNALEEMRALLLELRPSGITDEKLGDLIRQVATIIANRVGLEVSVKVLKQETVPPEVHFVLYRVVQEALNNIAHHALAEHIDIYFNSADGCVDMTIQDDGLGFDPTSVNPERLGLSIMRDRIENIGGTLETLSNKGAGTLIRVNWNAPTLETVV